MFGQVEAEIEQETANNQYEKGIFRASNLGGCARAIQYGMLGYRAERITPELKLLLDDGKIHEENVISRLSKIGTVTNSQMTLKKRFTRNGISFVITGAPDGIFEGWVFDSKSMSIFPFKKLDKEYPEKYEKYTTQLTIYMHILKLPGFFVFKCKNDAEWNIKEFKYSKKRMEDILQKAAAIAAALKTKILIDKPFERNSWECKTCPFRLHCWKLPMEQRKWGQQWKRTF